MNSRLVVTGDVSMNSRLFLATNSLYVNGSIFTGGSSSTFTTDVSINNRLFVGSDISMNGNLYVGNIITCNELIINSTDSTASGFVFADIITASGGLISSSDVTLNQRLFVSGALVTQGLVYEAINTATQTTANVPAFSFGTGGVWTLGTTLTANATLTVTNIPTDTTKSYTFSVVSYFANAATRYYISSVVFTNTDNGSILTGAPLFNGGTPTLTGTTPCVIIQQFTVVSVGGNRRVISSVSSCS